MRFDFRTAAACILASGMAAAPAAFAQSTRPRTRNAQVIISRGETSYLGIGVVDIDAERAKALSLKEERGVEIKSVSDDSPAAKAGLKVGDVVLDFNGQPVEGTEQFQRLVRETPAGRQVKLGVWRGGSVQPVTATLGTRKGGGWMESDGHAYSFTMPPVPPMPPMPPMPDTPRFEMSWRNATLGIEGESLGSQLADFFGVKEGVLVRMVVKNSAAEKAGIKAGDVITKVNDSTVTSAREISSILRSNRAKKTFPVVLVRNRKEMTLTVTIDDKTGSGGSGVRAGRVRIGALPSIYVDFPQIEIDLPEIHLPEIRVPDVRIDVRGGNVI